MQVPHHPDTHLLQLRTARDVEERSNTPTHPHLHSPEKNYAIATGGGAKKPAADFAEAKSSRMRAC